MVSAGRRSALGGSVVSEGVSQIANLSRWLWRAGPTLAIAAGLFVAITAARFLVDPDIDGVTLLYTLPIALMAVRFGWLGGLATAAFGMAGYVVWVQVEDVSAALIQYAVRGVAFAVLGLGLGIYSARLRRAGREERRLLRQAAEALARERALQDELQAALALHAQAEEASGFGSWVWHLESDSMRWSEGLYALLGLQPGTVEPSFKAFLQLVHPDDRARVMDSGRRALESGEPPTDEFRIVRPDGKQRTLLGVGKAVLGDGGQTVSILGTAQDVTSGAIADRELRASEARYRALMEHAPEAIVVLDLERGCFTQVNENAARLFKLSRERLVRAGPIELSPPTQPDGRSSAEAARAYIDQAVAGSTPAFEWVHRAADGTDVVCDVRLVRLPDDERVLVRGSITDITARKRMQAQLARADADKRIAARARDLHRVTEAALAHLSLDELLPELLTRLRDILAVDNAAILLADDRGDLTVTTAQGPEQAVIGMRLPAGAGFAGRVASGRSTIALYGEELRRVVVNPVLRQVRALLGTPLVVEGRVVGVLHIGSLSERRFTDDEMSLLQLAADRAALGIEHAQMYERERSTAETLQRSLLPESLPTAPEFELAATYQAAGQGWDVGGDFYDAFEIEDGHWLIVIGDACGKGPEAAALTALARYTLRAEAARDPSPAGLLRRLNQAIIKQSSEIRFCTATCALVEIGEATRLTVSVGGHPLPLVLRQAGDVYPVGRPGDLIGAFAEVELSQTTTVLGAGDTVVFYTDGLVEAHAPHRTIELPELMGMLAACAGLTPSALIPRLFNEATADGTGPPRDDLAILALRRSPSGAAAGE
jgi:sigma-B regulation protein RsbU (phosphoserine phosphatase)